MFAQVAAIVRFVLFCCVLAVSVQAQPASPPLPSIRLLVVGATNDGRPTFASGAAANIQNVKKAFSGIAGYAGMGFASEEITGTELTCANIRKKVEDLRGNPNDVLILYYAGHGFRRPTDTSMFPRFYCDSTYRTEFSVENAKSILADPNRLKRMVLIIADTCNDVVRPSVRIRPVSIGRGQGQSYADLFMKYRGNLILAGAKADTLSYYRKDGGLFTNQFLSVLNNAVAQGSERQPTWSQLIPPIISPLSATDENGNRVTQRPVALNELTRVP